MMSTKSTLSTGNMIPWEGALSNGPVLFILQTKESIHDHDQATQTIVEICRQGNHGPRFGVIGEIRIKP